MAEMPRCRLYLLTPPTIVDLDDFAASLDDALAADDVACLQLRLKDCDDGTIVRAISALRPVAQARNVAFILNDRPDLATAHGCDGVHVGPEDMSYADARRIMGDDATVGVTCRNSRHLAMDLAEAGADYVAFGAFFPSSTKDASTGADPELLEIWSETTTVPCVAIGGITVENCAPLVLAGADFIAVSAGVWNHSAGAVEAVRAFNAIFAGAGAV